MDRVPDSRVTELLGWIAYKRDAAWATKLAILRVRRLENIACLGACLRDHDRHAEELAQLVRAVHPQAEIPDGPSFVARDALAIGAMDPGEAVLDALVSLEERQIARYEQRRRPAERARASTLDALLERHLADARAHLRALQRCRAESAASHEAAA